MIDKQEITKCYNIVNNGSDLAKEALQKLKAIEEIELRQRHTLKRLKLSINDRIDEIVKLIDPPLVEEEFLYVLLHKIEEALGDEE